MSYRWAEARTIDQARWFRMEVDGSVEPVDPARPQKLYDPGNGTLVETTGDTFCFYPGAHLDSDNLIKNTEGKGWVQQITGHDFNDEPAFFDLMAEAADPEHPIWEGCLKHGYEEQRVVEVPKARQSSKAKPDDTASDG